MCWQSTWPFEPTERHWWSSKICQKRPVSMSNQDDGNSSNLNDNYAGMGSTAITTEGNHWTHENGSVVRDGNNWLHQKWIKKNAWMSSLVNTMRDEKYHGTSLVTQKPRLWKLSLLLQVLVMPQRQAARIPLCQKKCCWLERLRFLLDRQERSLDANIVLQGFVAKCPIKSTNNRRHRIAWENNTALSLPTLRGCMV